MIRVVLPYHLRILASVGKEVSLEVEDAYPMLRGTIRDHATKERRPFLRFFAVGRDLSFESSDSPLPDPVVAGQEPFLIIAAIAGG